MVLHSLEKLWTLLVCLAARNLSFSCFEFPKNCNRKLVQSSAPCLQAASELDRFSVLLSAAKHASVEFSEQELVCLLGPVLYLKTAVLLHQGRYYSIEIPCCKAWLLELCISRICHSSETATTI